MNLLDDINSSTLQNLSIMSHNDTKKAPEIYVTHPNTCGHHVSSPHHSASVRAPAHEICEPETPQNITLT